MRRLLVIMMVFGLAAGASAQAKIRGQVPQVNRSGSGNGGKQQVIIVTPRSYYNPYYSPFYGYSRWGYSPYGFGYNRFYGMNQASTSVPTELDLEIEKIKSDYGYEISEVRRNKSIPKSERKEKIRDLKHERDIAVLEAKKSYYKNGVERN
jgi:hypothetical protein